MPKWTGVRESGKKILGSKPTQRTVVQQLKNAESGRNRLLQGRVNQLVIQYQTLNPESIHTSYIQLYRLSRYYLEISHVYKYTTINEEKTEAVVFKERKERHIGESGE